MKNKEIKRKTENTDKNRKKISGITLIALVITIIVLLLLVGVTLSTLSGQDGILNKAATAADRTNKMSAEEAIQVEVLKSYNNKGELDVADLNKHLINNLSGIKYKGEALSEENKISSLPTIVEYNGYSIVISEDEVTATQASVEVGKKVAKTEKYNYSDGGNVATVPAGFKVSEVSDEQKIENGLVIKDNDGNEFVWIPCTVSQYRNAKNAVTKNNWTTNPEYKTNGGGDGNAWRDDYTQTDNEKINEAYNASGIIDPITSSWEKNQTGVAEESISKYGGFYIARYEAGVPTDVDFYRSADGSDFTYNHDNRGQTTNVGLEKIKNLAPVSKKGVQAWNFISQPNSKIVAENMYKGNDNVGSYLVDSQAWNHICENIYGPNNSNKDITNSTKWGNYHDNTNTVWNSVNGLWANHKYSSGWQVANNYTNGAINVNPSSDENYIEIGTGICKDFKNYNIYDMAGNMWEWTTGHNINSETMFVVSRGR